MFPPVGYVTTLSVALQHANSVERYTGRMNDELEGIWKDAVMA
jgi:hypothetical protein